MSYYVDSLYDTTSSTILPVTSYISINQCRFNLFAGHDAIHSGDFGKLCIDQSFWNRGFLCGTYNLEGHSIIAAKQAT